MAVIILWKMVCPNHDKYGRIIPPFFLQKFRIWPFFIYLHDSNSIFGPGGLIQNYFRAAQFTIRLLHIVKDWDRARRRGPHHTDQPKKITSFSPFNHIARFVPTRMNYELHEIALHFFDSLRIIGVIFILV